MWKSLLDADGQPSSGTDFQLVFDKMLVLFWNLEHKYVSEVVNTDVEEEEKLMAIRTKDPLWGIAAPREVLSFKLWGAGVQTIDALQEAHA